MAKNAHILRYFLATDNYMNRRDRDETKKKLLRNNNENNNITEWIKIENNGALCA